MYDFDAQPGSGELSVKEGEILTVSRQDVGEGWWEGTNSGGQAGLFPAAYVEVSSLYIVVCIEFHIANHVSPILT